MNEATESLHTLREEIDSIKTTHDNLVGLVKKMATTQVSLSETGFQGFSNEVGEVFAELSSAAQRLQDVAHDAELERNRIENEA